MTLQKYYSRHLQVLNCISHELWFRRGSINLLLVASLWLQIQGECVSHFQNHSAGLHSAASGIHLGWGKWVVCDGSHCSSFIRKWDCVMPETIMCYAGVWNCNLIIFRHCLNSAKTLQCFLQVSYSSIRSFDPAVPVAGPAQTVSKLWNSTHHVFSHLHPGTTYQFYIRASTVKGFGPATAINVTTNISGNDKHKQIGAFMHVNVFYINGKRLDIQ